MIDKLKDMKWFITTLFSTLAMLGLNFTADDIATYMYMYNIHLMFMIFVGSYITYKISHIGHKRLEDGLNENKEHIGNIYNELKKSNLKARIEQAYRDYKDEDVIYFKTSIDLIYGLEEERKAMNLNSHHERSLKSLINRIKE